MNDIELINQIKSLKCIQPNQDWVFAVKKEILSKTTFAEFISGMFFQTRPVLVSAMFLFIVMFGLGFVEKSLPGDALYQMKRVAEDSQAVFLVSESDISEYKLGMANKRLEELVKIGEINQVKKIAPAIAAFQANVVEAAKNLTKMGDIKEFAIQAKKLEENKEKVASLGIIVGETREFDNAMASLVEREIKALEDQYLNEYQEKVLIEIKESFEKEDYNGALEKILFLSYPEILEQEK
ncbi:MAG: DUF5667 domain-containing protein [Patescibacteria group bacterium]